jgi:hypothetical protein
VVEESPSLEGRQVGWDRVLALSWLQESSGPFWSQGLVDTSQPLPAEKLPAEQLEGFALRRHHLLALVGRVPSSA